MNFMKFDIDVRFYIFYGENTKNQGIGNIRICCDVLDHLYVRILFSDEEEEVDEDVSLIVMKRPPITERVVEEVEVSN